MQFKKYFFYISLLFCTFSTVGAQTLENKTANQSGKTRISTQEIKVVKNIDASSMENIREESIKLVDTNQNNEDASQRANPCEDCEGLCNEITGECFEINVSSPYAGRTTDDFSVSLSGGASYTVPISSLPGIKNLAPNISLTFNSQSHNGLVGWGWNIGGLSSITRVSSTIYHDNGVDGVDFDLNDRFALDGQRLVIKSGTYGTANSEYRTENHSGIKVKAYGSPTYPGVSGPSYFIVFYPDGTRSWYGNAGGSKGHLEWALYKKQDAQGNYIEYNYSKSNNLLRINRIKYGSRVGTTPPNTIYFYYKTRTRPEVSYVNGVTFKRSNILDRIEVKGGSQLYRKYQLGHTTTSLGYQRVSSIVEYNENNQSFPPIYFSYESSTNGVTRDGFNTSWSGTIDQHDRAVSGDFDGNGKMSFFLYDTEENNQLRFYGHVFDDPNTLAIGSVVNLPNFETIFTNNSLASDGKMLPKQAITYVTESGNTVSFKTISMLYNDTYFPNYSVVNEYTKSWNKPVNEDFDYMPGDFNGDGITDVLAVSKSVSRDIYFIDLKRDVTSNFSNLAGDLAIMNSDTNGKVFTIDFDGDKKTELMQLVDGNVIVYSLNSNNEFLFAHASLFDSNLDKDKLVLLGDYNGDGKTDFAQPSANNSSTWRFYLSKGNSFYNYSKNIGVNYQESYVYQDGNGIQMVNGISMQYPVYEYHFIAQDFNGDGISDILKHEVVSPFYYNNVVSDRVQLYANKLYSNQSTPSFSLSVNSLATNNGISSFGKPIFVDSQNAGAPTYGYVSGEGSNNSINTYEFNRDHNTDTSLKTISNDGVITNISYERLISPTSTSTYTFDDSEVYPFTNINIAQSLKLVNEVTRTGAGHTQTQLYKYRGAVSHAQGLGFLGFKHVMKTNWFGNGVAELWNISEHDMQKRGAVSREWVSLYSSHIPINFINKTTYTYYTFHPNYFYNVFVNNPITIVKQDNLLGTTSTETISYDSYYNPEVITNTFSGGTKTVTYEYDNNPSPTNHLYHIGRPTKKIESNTLGGNTFSTETQFSYNNNLVYQSKVKGNNTPWLTKDIQYDQFGNIIQETLSGNGITPRIESFEYDTSGRYLIKSTDVQGLETNMAYNTINGNILSSTSPYGLTSTFQYDGWNRVIREVNYLGKITNYFYNKESVPGNGNCYTKLTDYPEREDEKTYSNVFGWLVQSKVLTLHGKWIQKKFEHDAMGRTLRESEPYFDNASASQWNQFYFDEYGRPISTQLYTGKIITTSYNGLSTTVNDGTKTIITTKDAVGNVLELQDPGGTVNYQYHGNGLMKSANYDNHSVTTTIDGWGRKNSLNDPTAGNYVYNYNILGEILEESTPKGTTTYQYDDYGKIELKEISGDNTDLSIQYIYNNSSKILETVNGTDSQNQKSFTYSYEYDNYYRVEKTTESTNDAIFAKHLTYDDFGRVNSEEYETQSLLSGLTNSVKIKHVFDGSGMLLELRDYNTNNLLWKIDEENARRQALSIELGNGIIKSKSYDSYGFITNITDSEHTIGGIQALKMDYSFNAQRGILNSRKNYAFTNWNESFTFDNLDRLTHVNGAVNRSHNYDNKGRISFSNIAGGYNYNNSNNYQLENIVLNSIGNSYYQQRRLQQVKYNAFKKPVEIFEEDNGRVDFEYGPMMNRTVAYYGGLQEDKLQRQYTKIYSSIMPVEIVENNDLGSTKIITYVGGDPYTAPIAQIKREGAGTDLNEYHYLHRDYLGSILAISNSSTELVEERQFGAWGKVDKFFDQNNISDFTHDSLIGRGYTGHEHFFEVSLIHMNGRMYDSYLGRFLSPDNFVQEPFNSQSFNRYGYVQNNPLSFIDPGGEFFWAAVAIGAFLGGFSASMSGGGVGDFFFGILTGGLIGGITAGVGNLIAGGSFFGNAAMSVTGFWAGATVGAASGFVGGFLGTSANAWIKGANFGEGLFSGLKGGVVSGIFGGALGGLTAGIRAHKNGYNFWDGKTLNTKTLHMIGNSFPLNEPIPATDENLLKATKEWYPVNPMDNVVEYSVENLSDYAKKVFAGNPSIGGVTYSSSRGGILTGNSKVFFNAPVAFSSPQELYKVIGHELLHVSQLAALAGQNASILTESFIDMMEFNAYNFRATPGFSAWGADDVKNLMLNHGDWFKKLGRLNFEWTFKALPYSNIFVD